MAMNSSTRIARVAGLALALLAAGCASNSQYGETKRASIGQAADADGLAAPASHAVIVSRSVYENEGVWLNRNAVEIKDRTERLPPIFDRQISFVYNPASSTADLMRLLSRTTGLRFSEAPDLSAELTRQAMNGYFRADMTLREVLDGMAARQNVSWRWRDGQVDVYRYDTRVFQVMAFIGQTAVGANIANKGDTSSESVVVTSQASVWEGIKGDVAQLTSSAGKVTFSVAMGTITVTDLPQNLSQIEAWVKQLNDSRSKMVSLDVKVYSIEVDAASNLGINWSAVYSHLGPNASLSLTTVGLSTGAGTSGLGVSLGGTGPWAGTTALVAALATQGNVSLVQEFHQAGVSGEAIPLQASTSQAYVASTTTTQTANVGSSSSLTTATITYGMSMSFIPKVSSNDLVQLEGTIDLSSLDSLALFSSRDGNNTVQLPQRSSRVNFSRVLLHSGRPFLLTGYTVDQNVAQRQGLGSAGSDAWSLASGGLNAAKSHKTLVVLVTPYVIDATQ